MSRAIAFTCLVFSSFAVGCSAGGSTPASEVESARAALDDGDATVCVGPWTYQRFQTPCYANAPSWDCPGSFHRTCTEYQTCANPAFGISGYSSKKLTVKAQGELILDCPEGPGLKPVCQRRCDMQGWDPKAAAQTAAKAAGASTYTGLSCAVNTLNCLETCTLDAQIPIYNSKAAPPCPVQRSYECGTELTCRTASNGPDTNPQACGIDPTWRFSEPGLTRADAKAKSGGIVSGTPSCAAPIDGRASLATARTLTDTNTHAFLAQVNGDLREVWYLAEQSTVGTAVIGHHDGVVAIAAFNARTSASASLADRVHVICATASGDVYDTYYTPRLGVHDYQLLHKDEFAASPVIAMSAWADWPDSESYQTIAFLLQNGDVYTLRYSGIDPASVEEPVLLSPSTATAMTGYSDGTRDHLVLLDGDLIDISWAAGGQADFDDSMTEVSWLREGDASLQSIGALAGVSVGTESGFSPAGHNHLAVLASDTGAHLDEIAFSTGVTAQPTVPVATLSGTPKAVSAFVTDGYPTAGVTQHFVVLNSEGRLFDYRQTGLGNWSLFPLGIY